MKDVIKLTAINGQAVYIRDTYNVHAIASERDGDMVYTSIFMLGFACRVKEPTEKVAELLGWEPKQIEAAKS